MSKFDGDESMKRVFALERVKGQNVKADEIIPDIKRVAERLNSETLTQAQYRKYGKYSPETVKRYLGGWNAAVESAGLKVKSHVNYGDEKLFDNILILWEYYGRQPRRAELEQEPSVISQSPYNRRFGSWTNALNAFVSFANESEIDAPRKDAVTKKLTTPRQASLRLRYRVLKRDNFSCCTCGVSPATTPGLQLHVDHIVAWSLGGLTIEDNLQTLCEPCNLGKSNKE